MDQAILGGWDIKVCVDGMPEKVATAFCDLNEQLVGANYFPIAYLGSQIVKGTNHAVLGRQTIINADNTKNVVLIVFNEPHVPGKIIMPTPVYIDPVLNGFSQECGGVTINEDFKITEEAQKDFDSVIKHFVGSDVRPFAYLGYQVVKGVNRFFAAEVTPLYVNARKSISLVTVNAQCNTIHFKDII